MNKLNNNDEEQVQNDFEQAKRDIIIAETISKQNDEYKAFLESTIGLIPWFGDFINKEIEIKFEEFQNEKQRVFIDVILQNKEFVTPDMVQDVEFVTNFARALEMIKRLSSNEKVVYFGNLICNGYFKRGKKIQVDVFDEYVSILNEMSYREIEYLTKFAEYATLESNRTVQGKALEDYYTAMYERYKDINPVFVLKRLERTGFIKEFITYASVNNNTLIVNDSSDANEKDLVFYLTPEYDEFEQMVINKMNHSSGDEKRRNL